MKSLKFRKTLYGFVLQLIMFDFVREDFYRMSTFKAKTFDQNIEINLRKTQKVRSLMII